MTESTAIEQPASDSIHDDLAAAFDGFDDDFNEIDETSEEPESEEAPEVEEIDEEDSEADEVEEEGAETEEQEQPAVEAPSHWSAADKETFSKAPPELQAWLLDRHKSMEGDYTRKSQEISEIRKTWEPVQELFAPHMEQLRMQGQTPASIIQGWASWEAAITQNPEQAIRELARQRGVQLGQSNDDDLYVDPKTEALERKLEGLQQQILQREQYEAQQRQMTTEQTIQSFAEELTEAGELAHPYYEEVVEDMTRLAKVERAEGRTPVLKELYEKAVWANPITREKELAAKQHAAAKKAESEARAKAAKAKVAKKTIKSSPDGDSVSEMSLREELERALGS